MATIKRSFFLACFAVVVAAAVCLTLFYRHVSLQALIYHAETNNEVVAREFLRSLSPSLGTYLESVADVESSAKLPPLPDDLAASIAALLKQEDVKEITIFTRSGRVVFSSEPTELVIDHTREPGVLAAVAGKVASEFMHRDTISKLDFSTAPDNLVQSYIPIVSPGNSRIVGVFDLYTDVNDVVNILERTELLVLLGSLIGFALLTVALFAVFRRAGEVIESAHREVEHHKRKLSWASLRVLRSHEKSREKLSADLQSGIVQTLSAVKLSIENAIIKAAKGKLAANDPALDSITPIIQEIIGTLSSLASEIHPASLRDLGLLPALGRVCAEFQRAHRSIEVESSLHVTENEVPEHLKFTIYRAVQTVLENVDRLGSHDSVKILVAVKRRRLTLCIDLGRSGAAGDSSSGVEQVGALAGVEEAVILSHGTFTVSTEQVGVVRILATWVLDLEQSVAADG